ncbi:MAG: hypothetical protein ACOC1F_01670 [Myxococcota bacterium]
MWIAGWGATVACSEGNGDHTGAGGSNAGAGGSQAGAAGSGGGAGDAGGSGGGPTAGSFEDMTFELERRGPGTEVTHILEHDGKLFAAANIWSHADKTVPSRLVRKDGPDALWETDGLRAPTGDR